MKNHKKGKILAIVAPFVMFLIFANFFLFSDIHGEVFLVILLLVFAAAFFAKSGRKTFFRLQANLPTSRIRSLAMGLVEIQGKTIEIETVTSRLEEITCIGYRFKEEKVTRDTDGDKSYHTVEDITICKPFKLKDDTGEILVDAIDIEFVSFEKQSSYERGNRIYTEYVLLADQEMLLIGEASADNYGKFIKKDQVRSVFAVSPIEKVNLWNDSRPLRNNLAIFGIVFAILMALVLMADMELKDGILHIDIQHIFNSATK